LGAPYRISTQPPGLGVCPPPSEPLRVGRDSGCDGGCGAAQAECAAVGGSQRYAERAVGPRPDGRGARGRSHARADPGAGERMDAPTAGPAAL
ncbi:hypothetical protein IW137_003073, partial [Coemansia sp. RSA 1287]